MEQSNKKEWLRPKDLAMEYGIQKGTLFHLEKMGKIRISRPSGPGRLAYVRRADIEDFLSKGYDTPLPNSSIRKAKTPKKHIENPA